MRAIEFQTQIGQPGQIDVPKGIAAQLPTGTRARVIVLVSDDEEPDGAGWDRFASQAVSQYYSPEDKVYDDYPRR